MITLFTSILFALSTNIDNIAIGMSYGIKKIKISFQSNSIIALSTSLITYLTMLIARNFTNLFEYHFIHLLGASILIIIGILSLLKSFYDCYHKAPKKEISSINKKTLLHIILALSCNNIATGIAASMTSMNLLFIFLFTFLFSYLFIYIGNTVGQRLLNESLEKYANFFSSIILILLGLIEIQ